MTERGVEELVDERRHGLHAWSVESILYCVSGSSNGNKMILGKE